MKKIQEDKSTVKRLAVSSHDFRPFAKLWSIEGDQAVASIVKSVDHNNNSVVTTDAMGQNEKTYTIGSGQYWVEESQDCDDDYSSGVYNSDNEPESELESLVRSTLEMLPNAGEIGGDGEGIEDTPTDSNIDNVHEPEGSLADVSVSHGGIPSVDSGEDSNLMPTQDVSTTSDDSEDEDVMEDVKLSVEMVGKGVDLDRLSRDLLRGSLKI